MSKKCKLSTKESFLSVASDLTPASPNAKNRNVRMTNNLKRMSILDIPFSKHIFAGQV